MPPWVPHQEINASTSEPLECVLVRSDKGPVAVNLDIAARRGAGSGASGDPAQNVQILQRLACADDNDAERILGQGDGEAGLLAQ